ncbi:hypothetical protein PENNAL_c0262G09235 [Penicillium nalgiovense]|uniref:Uncharacterized protein n=1 Tax=Penicillium nalgiovense TaxID=60175 RepID=A0A1V6V3R0_PENNA|nr:hypothetical protein PENNAL_c0654G00459 [Penicillium nalgiovense]OQE62537.1 hypothetical protein PENNAL_c0262G09235 [Penicillium nalgiovense]
MLSVGRAIYLPRLSFMPWPDRAIRLWNDLSKTPT